MPDESKKERFLAELQACQRQLYGFIFSLVRDVEIAQEIYQQTCLSVWEKFDQFEGRSSFATWVCGVARNNVRDHFKKSRRYHARFSDSFEEQLAALAARMPVDDMDHRLAALEICLEKLPDDQRALVRQRYGTHATVADVARQMGRSTRAVYSTLKKIRESLMQCIDRAIADEVG